MRRVVITGMGIWSCLGKNKEEVAASLREGKSGIGIDPQRKKTAWTDEERKAVMKEVDTRDWHWLYTGEPAVTDYRRKPYEKLVLWEKKAVDSLSKKHGVSLATIKEDNDAPANLDFIINGHGWELKSPKSGKHAVDDRLKDAFAKFKKIGSREARIIVSNSESVRSDKEVLDECLRRIAYRKKTGRKDRGRLVRWKRADL